MNDYGINKKFKEDINKNKKVSHTKFTICTFTFYILDSICVYTLMK